MKMTTRHTYINVNGKVVHRIQAGGGGAIPANTPLPPQGTPLLAPQLSRSPLPHEHLTLERSQEHLHHEHGLHHEHFSHHEHFHQPVLTMEPRDDPEEDTLEDGGASGGHTPSVAQVIQPLLISLKCYGLVFRDREGRAVQFCTLYCVCVVCLLWFNALRYFAAYVQADAHGTQLFMKIIIHIWNLQCALSVTVFILVSYKNVAHFTALWAEYKRRYGGVPTDKMRGFACRVAMSINVFMLSFAVVGIALFSIKLPSLTSVFLAPLRVSNPVPVWAAAAYFTFHHYIAFCWIQPNIVLVILCVLLKKEFQEFASNFRATLVTPDTRGRPHCGGVSDIEGHRQRHLLLCKVSDTLDDMFSLFNLLTFLFDVPTICAFIFVMVKNEELFAQDVLALTASVAFFVIALTHVVSVTVAGASLCAAGKVPKAIIHDVDLRACTTQEGISVQVFLNRVTTEHIGLTAWKLVRIDRTLLIMVIPSVLKKGILPGVSIDFNGGFLYICYNTDPARRKPADNMPDRNERQTNLVFGLILSYVVVLFKFALVATGQPGEVPTVATATFRNATEYADDYR